MIFVTGTGRSGTSVTARTLSRMGVFMGEDLNEHHEDRAFSHLTLTLTLAQISLPAFGQKLASLIEAREEPWGVKSPYLSTELPLYTSLFPDALWIVCERDYDQTLESFMRTFGFDEEWAARTIGDRQANIRRYLPDAVTLDFTRRWAEDELEDTLRRIVVPYYEHMGVTLGPSDRVDQHLQRRMRVLPVSNDETAQGHDADAVVSQDH